MFTPTTPIPTPPPTAVPMSENDYTSIIALVFVLFLVSLFICICYINLNNHPIQRRRRVIIPVQFPHRVVENNNEGVEQLYKTPENSFDREMHSEGIKNSQEDISVIDIPMIDYREQLDELHKNPPIAFF